VPERYTLFFNELPHQIHRQGRGRMKNYSTLEAAKKIGVSKSTLFAWFKNGKVKDVARDHRGWRIFTEEDIHRLREYRRTHRAMPPGAAGIERRHFTRAGAVIPVVYTLRESPKHPGKEQVVEAVTINVGGGGFLIEQNEPLQADRFLDIRFNLPPPANKVKAIGQVRWVREIQKEHTSCYLLGCWFRSIKAHHRKQVIDYIFGSKPML
jgi:c-di-GMP-binding flagellar brake protein YcgR